MITINSEIISQYQSFVAGAIDSFLPIIGAVAGVFLAFMIFERVVRLILKSAK